MGRREQLIKELEGLPEELLEEVEYSLRDHEL